jgi:ABC-type uncharacterized transport system permease subunit
MSVAAVLMPVAGLVVSAADKTPKDNDVVAGGWGALVFVALILAVVVLAFSFVKQLRKAQAAKDAGVYGSDDDEPADVDEPENHSTS